ncbi:MAG: Ku protein [Nitrospirota bacterium]
MKSIWAGTIGFGLVNIPVKMFSATRESDLDLDMLDKKDHAPIHFLRVNSNTGKEVAWENIVRAYKYEDRYIVLDPKDFKNASLEKSNMIEIESFVNEKEIDSIYYEKPYYLEPGKTGVRAYGLLREALEKSGKVGVATFVLRNKEHLVLIKPSDKVIIVNRIRFQEEIRDVSEFKLPEKTEIKPQEL